jgi:hypothetical protein
LARYRLAFVKDVGPTLTLDVMPTRAQLNIQRRRVDRFQHPKPELIVDVEERPNDRSGEPPARRLSTHPRKSAPNLRTSAITSSPV